MTTNLPNKSQKHTNLSEHFRKVVDVSRSVCLSLEPLELQVVLCDIWRTNRKTMKRSFLWPVCLICHLTNSKVHSCVNYQRSGYSVLRRERNDKSDSIISAFYSFKFRTTQHMQVKQNNGRLGKCTYKK